MKLCTDFDCVLIRPGFQQSQHLHRSQHIQKYEMFKFLNGLAEADAVVGRIPLECNLDLLNYICFSKGCYIGQELTARTKYKVQCFPAA